MPNGACPMEHAQALDSCPMVTQNPTQTLGVSVPPLLPMPPGVMWATPQRSAQRIADPCRTRARKGRRVGIRNSGEKLAVSPAVKSHSAFDPFGSSNLKSWSKSGRMVKRIKKRSNAARSVVRGWATGGHLAGRSTGPRAMKDMPTMITSKRHHGSRMNWGVAPG